MLVGVPREVKNNEFRVAITPAGVHELTRSGHQVAIEKDAGVGAHVVELAGEQVQFLLGDGQPGKPGEVRDLVSGNGGHSKTPDTMLVADRPSLTAGVPGAAEA